MKTLGKMSCEIGLYSTYVLLKCEVSFHLARSATLTFVEKIKRRPSRSKLGVYSGYRAKEINHVPFFYKPAVE